jgi:hypothetical protein
MLEKKITAMLSYTQTVFSCLYKRARVFGAGGRSIQKTFIADLSNKAIGLSLLASIGRHGNISLIHSQIDVNGNIK